MRFPRFCVCLIGGRKQPARPRQVPGGWKPPGAPLGTPPRTTAGTCPARGDKCALPVAVWPPCLVCLSAYLLAVCLFVCLPREKFSKHAPGTPPETGLGRAGGGIHGKRRAFPVAVAPVPYVSVSAGLALGENCFLGRNHVVYRQGRGGAEKRRVLVNFPPAVGEVMRHMVDANSPPALLGQRTLAELLEEGLELEPSGGLRPGRGRALQALRAQGLRPLGTEGERERHPHVEMFAAGAA